ncbi:MAG: YihA family ribosome biogenesis GTP-binding protein [Epsilonproteobacteria bacterium]|nr:YihA family ribosome biogenesis GTP-binding protein [Campylobacterota bacterium]
MKIKSVKFIKSAQSIKDSIQPNFSEVAFLGRSNVGKSSFLNALTNQKIAKTSSTPGKTKLINFFEVVYENDVKTVFVDLPGFGYAKVSKKEQEKWQKNLNYFIANRFNIKLFVLLRDARHVDLDIDNNVYEYINHIKKPDQQILTIFTKVDKLNQKELSKLKNTHPNAIFVSNTKQKGIKEASSAIYKLLFGDFA